ncbi:hypothetical protein L195_g061471, partial [Trifolium pratense]
EEEAAEVGFVVVEKGDGEDPKLKAGEDPNENADVDCVEEDEDPNGEKPDIVASEPASSLWSCDLCESLKMWKRGIRLGREG